MAISRVYTDIDLTLRKDARSDVRKKVNADAINQHLKLLILTEQDEIPFLNNISADVRNLLFQPYSEHIKNTLNDVIENIVRQYEQRITISEISNEFYGNDLTVTINYIINQTRVVGQFRTILKRVR